MTEAEWLACENPRAILGLGPNTGSTRKMRLFAIECCRCSRSIVENDDYFYALAASERFADGREGEDKLQSVHKPIEDLASWLSQCATDELGRRLWAECSAVARATRWPEVDAFDAAWMVQRAAGDEMNKQLAALVREIFGNPFRWPLNDSTMPEPGRNLEWRWLWLPLAFVPEWRTSTAVALAKQMYESRDFSTMPILADALQDAGCVNEDILNHCRGDGPHVRGCWVVDMLLGKS